MTIPLPLSPVDLPALYAVVGERCDDPSWLLLLGSDGQHYAYRLLDGSVIAIDPDEAWRFDGAPPPPLATMTELVG
jgi:hypothetical protein